ncbi:MAG: NYN domain-containing protein [Thiotrichaceae bacterium]
MTSQKPFASMLMWSYDVDRAREDLVYRKGEINGYFSVLREYGFKVIQKHVKWYEDERLSLWQVNVRIWTWRWTFCYSRKLDRVMLVTGDGDLSEAAVLAKSWLSSGNCGVLIIFLRVKA